jgi:hypothetical protein
MISARKLKKQKRLIEEKVFLFDAMPNKCNGCSLDFDKKSREHANTWSVMVFQETKTVRLFCPECYKNVQAWAEDTIKEVKNEKG